ncbi:unnamed protein product [marine sediment metagenome]|uniref:Uncharacterized protein n=1 Tax=marine sediment metagenome TaxID=412755 RepID=X1LVJ0_9ZZZZ
MSKAHPNCLQVLERAHPRRFQLEVELQREHPSSKLDLAKMDYPNWLLQELELVALAPPLVERTDSQVVPQA